jgi:hypothetical protein
MINFARFMFTGAADLSPLLGIKISAAFVKRTFQVHLKKTAQCDSFSVSFGLFLSRPGATFSSSKG